VNEGVSAGLTRRVPLEEKKKSASGTYAANRRDDRARLSVPSSSSADLIAWTAREGRARIIRPAE